MAGYKVSYKVLTQQGDALKALAKEVDGYASRVNAVCGRLGDDDLLVSVRQNLRKLSQQLGESRTVLNVSGEVVEKCVQYYGNTEKANVKKVDTSRAHNRDFYKNPVVVASSGNTVNYVTNNVTNVTNNYAAPAAASAAPDPIPAAAPAPEAAPAAGASASSIRDKISSLRETATHTPTVSASAAPETSGIKIPAEPAVSAPSPSMTQASAKPAEPGFSGAAMAAAVSGAAVGGMAAGAGGLFGVQKLRAFLKNKEEQKQQEASIAALEQDELEEMLAKARAEAEKYQKHEDNPA